MNKVVLIGNLTRDPELQTTNSGVSVCRFSLAVTRRFANSDGERDADFINITVWRNQAENCHKYLKKGSKCAVIGRIQTSSYDAPDGSKRYTTDVVADSVQFLESKNSASTGGASAGPSPYDYQDAPSEVNVSDDPFADFGDSVSIDDNFLD
jgi:single-strand DNA-binding protein